MGGEALDLIIRSVPGYGYLPIIVDSDGKELYRGEYHRNIADAVERIEKRESKIRGGGYDAR